MPDRSSCHGFLSRRRVLPFLVLLVAGLGLSAPVSRPAAQEPAPPLEYQVKAAFLFNFAKFIEWPPGTFHGPEEPFLVCVVGDEGFARAFDLVVSGKSVEGRVLRVRRLRTEEDPAACRILYLGAAGLPRAAAVLKSARTGSTLTVGDAPGFIRQGGIINFVMQDNRVHFDINPDAAQRAGLRISSKLLQLATIVEDASAAEGER